MPKPTVLPEPVLRPEQRIPAWNAQTSGIIVEIDKREKIPLLFPRTMRWSPRGKAAEVHVSTEPATLETFDYVIRGHARTVGIERKWNVGELRNNIEGDRTRARRWQACLARMKNAATYRYLFLDMTWREMFPHDDHDAGRVWDLLISQCHDYGIRLIGPMNARSSVLARRRAGEWLLRIMLSRIFSGGN